MWPIDDALRSRLGLFRGACGVSNEEVAKVQPEVIRGTYSRLGAGDAFFAYFLSYKELNPSASLNKSLYAANRKTRNYLKAND